MFILVDKDNVVVDFMTYVRYIKPQSSTNIIIGCEEKEGTGVIGSDCDTHYPLIQNTVSNPSNAVRVIKVDNIPDFIEPQLYKYNTITAEFECVYCLEEMQALKQTQNKEKLREYLAENPLTWTDGKQYGVTAEDQTEINFNITQYQLGITSTLEWHAKHEENCEWELDNLVALSNAINAFVYPCYHKMQEIKKSIYNAKSIQEIQAIELTY